LKEPEILNPQEELALQLASNPEYMKQIEAGLKLARERAASRSLEEPSSPSRGSPGEESLSSTPVDPMEAASIVAAATKGMIPTTPTPSVNEEGSSSITSSFSEYMKGAVKGPVLSKIPSLPTVPSVPSVPSVPTES